MRPLYDKVIDVSGPVEEGMWGYGDPLPNVSIRRIASVEKEGFDAHSMHIHSLAGTYMESARHIYPGRETIGQIPPQRLILKAKIARLKDKQWLESVSAEELEEAAGSDLQSGEALLISTGWDQYWNKPGYAERCPFLLPEAMEWIVDKNVDLLGVDFPHLQDPRDDDGKLLRLYYKRDRLLLAPLINLRKAGQGSWTLIALPMMVPEACSSPCRAVLLADGD